MKNADNNVADIEEATDEELQKAHQMVQTIRRIKKTKPYAPSSSAGSGTDFSRKGNCLQKSDLLKK